MNENVDLALPQSFKDSFPPEDQLAGLGMLMSIEDLPPLTPEVHSKEFGILIHGLRNKNGFFEKGIRLVSIDREEKDHSRIVEVIRQEDGEWLMRGGSFGEVLSQYGGLEKAEVVELLLQARPRELIYAYYKNVPSSRRIWVKGDPHWI